jgi:hypothetical protein
MVLEEIEFEFLRTPQDEVYRERLDYYIECYKKGNRVPPIDVFPFGEYDELLILNGNHRARAQYEMGIEVIQVQIVSPKRMGGLIKTIPELIILPGDRKSEKGIQLPKFRW